MQGLRTRENDKFLKFWEVIQRKAQEEGKMFFSDCGEGRDFETEDMEGEDMRGWLIPLDNTKQFEKQWMNHEALDEWVDRICWAEWENMNGKITVKFNFY